MDRAEQAGTGVLLIADLAHRETLQRLQSRRPLNVLWRPVRHGSLIRVLARLAGHDEPTQPQGVEDASIEGLRVLLAEDNLVNQRMAGRMLEKAGCTVTLASNGREAVDAFVAGAFDVVLMDVQMPELGATREIRALGGVARRVPIVALTGNAMKGDREECIAAGMDDYLTKPFRYDDLVSVIAKVARGAREPAGES